MNTTLSLLQLVLALLQALQQPNIPTEVRAKALQLAQQAVQIATAQSASSQSSSPSVTVQPSTTTTTSSPFNSTALINADMLRSVAYITPDGKQKPGAAVQILENYTSFGDLNADNFDDAVVVVRIVPSGYGNPQYQLAAVLNTNGVLSNVSSVPLPGFDDIPSHRIENGTINLDLKNSSSVRTVRYRLSNGQLQAL